MEKNYNFVFIEFFVMSVFSIFAIGFLIVKASKSFLDGLFEQQKPAIEIKKPRKYNVMYYSEGKLLPNPFYKEYKMIADTVADSWIYEDQWQDLVNENHDAPLVEIDVKLPLPYRHSYSFKHVFLANNYLHDQKNYLENLS